jgi:malate dehydrogenase
MFSKNLLRQSATTLTRSFSSSSSHLNKVTVLGASGGIGQPLSMLLKLDDKISHLSLYDIANTPGVAADLSHVSTPTKVTGHIKDEQLGDALKGSHIVVIPAGVPRKPGMTRDDLFNTNATIVRNLARACAQHCPEALIAVIANPVNSTVPIVAETLKQAGVYDPRKVFGVTTLDVVRSKTFVGEHLKTDPRKVEVNVIGGHAGTTILPLLSQISNAKFSAEDIKALSHRIQFGGDEVVKAKDGAGSATLSMAYAGYLFTVSLLRALNGEKNVVECTFTENKVSDASFFSTPTRLGKNGVEEHLSFGKLSNFEQETYNSMIGDLKTQIQKGVAFVKQ